MLLCISWVWQTSHRMVRMLISFFLWVIWISWYTKTTTPENEDRKPKTRTRKRESDDPLFFFPSFYICRTGELNSSTNYRYFSYLLFSLFIFFNTTGLLNVYLPIYFDCLQSVFSFKTRPVHIPANEITNTAPSWVTHGVILERKIKDC